MKKILDKLLSKIRKLHPFSCVIMIAVLLLMAIPVKIIFGGESGLYWQLGVCVFSVGFAQVYGVLDIPEMFRDWRRICKR